MIPYLYIRNVPKDREKFEELISLLGDKWEDGSIRSFLNSSDTTGIQWSIATQKYGFVINDNFKYWNKEVDYKVVIANKSNLRDLTHWGLEVEELTREV